MNKKYLLSVSCLVLAFLFLNSALATVGGPTIVDEIRYDETEKSIYFTRPGDCPVTGVDRLSIIKYNHQTQETSSLFECSLETLRCLIDGEWEDYEKSEAIKEEIWLKLTPLPRIDLKKNNFEIEILMPESMPREAYGGAWGFANVPLKALILQHDEKIAEIDFTICDRYFEDNGSAHRQNDFDINFDGFLLPDSNQALLLVSNESDCHEYGYVVDKIFSLTDVKITDSRSLAPLTEARQSCHEGPYWSAYPPYNTYVCPTEGGIFISIPNRISIILDAEEESSDPKEIRISMETSLAPDAEEESSDSKESRIMLAPAFIVLGAAVVLILFASYLVFKKRNRR